MIVEVQPSDSRVPYKNAIEQLRHQMASTGCSVGLAVSGEHIFLLRDSLEKFHGESIAVVGEAKLPESLLPAPDKQGKGAYAFEFESRVQHWLETLKLTPNLETLPSDLRELFGEPIKSLLRFGEIRAASPRWSRVVS